ncbi:MAG: outer membrane protein assembly factor BamC [Thalassolituus sp.]|jgi:outer membrane protein assembly factor BamC
MRLLCILPLAALSGCSWMFGDTFDNRALDYLEAQESPATQVPADITLNTYDRYPVPDVNGSQDLADEFIIPVPDPIVIDETDTGSTSLSEYQSYDLNPRIEKDGAGTEVLRLDTEFAVSWAKVADAVAGTDLKMTDLNRSLGIYFLELPNPDAANDDRSWWAKLWSDPVEPTLTYELKMVNAGEGVYVSLLQDAETLADTVTTRSVLTQVRDQLTQ